MAERIVNCPNCGKCVESMDYAEYGAFVWMSVEWIRVRPVASLECFCLHCKYSFTDEDLEKLGFRA